MVVGGPVVPDPQRQQGQQVHQVVIEQHGQGHRLHRGLAGVSDDEVEHVHGDRLDVHCVGHAVPVVEGVQAFGPRAGVVVGHRPPEVDRPPADVPDVLAHALAQPLQGVGQVPPGAGVRQDRRPLGDDLGHQGADVRRTGWSPASGMGIVIQRPSAAASLYRAAGLRAIARGDYACPTRARCGPCMRDRKAGSLPGARCMLRLSCASPGREDLMLVRFLPLVVAAVCSVATAHAQPALRARLLGEGFTRPIAVVVDPVVPGAVHVVQQDGLVLTVRQRRAAGRAVPRPDLGRDRGPATSAACSGMAFPPDAAATGRVFVNFTNRTGAGNTVVARFTRSAADPLVARPGVALRPDVAGVRRGVDSPSSPSRSPTTTAATWRSAPTATCTSAWAMAAPATTPTTSRRRRPACSARCCASTSPASPTNGYTHPARQPRLHDGQSADHQRVAGNLVVRPAQPLALQLRQRRPRRHRRPRDRRRRPGRPRGDRLRTGRARRQQLRLERLRGADREPGDRRADAGLPAGDRAGLRLPAHLRQCDHRRLRLSRHPARRLLPGTLLLRRLRLGTHLVAGADDRFAGRRRGLGQPRSHGGARRAVPLHHLVCPRRRRRALLHGLRRQQPGRQRPRLRARGRSRARWRPARRPTWRPTSPATT